MRGESCGWKGERERRELRVDGAIGREAVLCVGGKEDGEGRIGGGGGRVWVRFEGWGEGEG